MLCGADPNAIFAIFSIFKGVIFFISTILCCRLFLIAAIFLGPRFIR
jgi:hypothetical protein